MGGKQLRNYQRTAQEHARVLSFYGKNYKGITKETVMEHTAEVKRNVEAAQKEFTKLDAHAKQDPEVAKSLKIINDLHVKVLEHCKMADAEGSKDAPEMTKLCECCDGMVKDLEAAEAEHTKLLKHLKMEPVEVLSKVSPKK